MQTATAPEFRGDRNITTFRLKAVASALIIGISASIASADPAPTGTPMGAVEPAAPALATLLRAPSAHDPLGEQDPRAGLAQLAALDALSGHPIDLASRRDDVTIVHFFATWCEPCRPEMAALQRLATRYAGRPLTILAVDVGEVEPRLRRFFADAPPTFPVLLDRDRAATKVWLVSALPTTLVLDRTRTLRLLAQGDVAWDGPDANAALTQLLAPPVGAPEPQLHLNAEPAPGTP